MGYKLYDFDDPQIDEQVRILADVLYNHREQYSNQVITIAESGPSLPRPGFLPNNKIFWEAISMLANTTTNVPCGFNLARIRNTYGTTRISASSDVDGMFLQITNDASGVHILDTDTFSLSNKVTRQLLFQPYFQVWLKTTSSSADVPTSDVTIESGFRNDLVFPSDTVVEFRYAPPPTTAFKRFQFYVQHNGSGTYYDLSNEPDLDVDTNYFLSMKLTRMGTNNFTADIVAKTRKINPTTGTIISQTSNTYQFTNLTINENKQVQHRALVINNFVSQTTRIKFHSTYAEYFKPPSL